MKEKLKKTKRQHYVPIVYLKGFSNSIKKEYFLSVYDKENGNIFPSNIRRIGHENFFYDIDGKNLIEIFFGKFEGQFGKILKKITNKKDLKYLNENDKKVLSCFISIQFLRSKEKRIMQKQIAEKLINLVGKVNIPNFKEGEITLSEDTLRRSHDLHIFENFIPISKILIDEMSWKLCINTTKNPFWTSDNPCAIYNELEPESHKGNLGLKCKGFQLHFPLSSDILLILMNKNLKLSDLSRTERFRNKELKEWLSKIDESLNLDVVDLIPDNEFVNNQRVIFENNLQVVSSTQFIFSRENDFSLSDKYLREYPFFKHKNRERLKRN